MNIVYLSLGSNIGNRIDNCIKALDELRGYSEIQKVSSIYETTAVGVDDQPDFINCAAKTKTGIRPPELLGLLNDIERTLGRKTKGDYSPRTIDIDIIFYNDLILETENLTIPHKQAHLRKFVLEPLCEINPEFQHPTLNLSLLQILQNINGTQEVKKIGSFY